MAEWYPTPSPTTASTVSLTPSPMTQATEDVEPSPTLFRNRAHNQAMRIMNEFRAGTGLQRSPVPHGNGPMNYQRTPTGFLDNSSEATTPDTSTGNLSFVSARRLLFPGLNGSTPEMHTTSSLDQAPPTSMSVRNQQDWMDPLNLGRDQSSETTQPTGNESGSEQQLVTLSPYDDY